VPRRVSLPTPGSTTPDRHDPARGLVPTGPPEVLGGRYELGDLLGVGGVARVFKAHDRVLHRDVAVKLFGPGIDPSGPERERAEMRTLAGMSHLSLVTLHDAGTDHHHTPPQAYLVMALVDGRSLAEELESGPLPEAQVRDLGAHVASALAYVHGSGVVHRDVKPANILLDRGGRPFLTDFGIARAVGAAALTAVGDTVGTAAYLSPEQVRGEEVGPETDVYALGLVLLEALTGVREYPGSTAETALARLTRPPRLDAVVQVDLRELLAEMTASEPGERPKAEQVASRLTVEAGVGAGVTQVLHRAAAAPPPAAAPPVDGTRLLTTAQRVDVPAGDVLGRVGLRADEILRRSWTRSQPWVGGRRNLIVAVLGVLVLLGGLLVIATTSGHGSAGSGAGVTPLPPAGNPGPSRLAPDLARLHELVQP
jgi:hypothetical protein